MGFNIAEDPFAGADPSLPKLLSRPSPQPLHPLALTAGFRLSVFPFWAVESAIASAGAVQGLRLLTTRSLLSPLYLQRALGGWGIGSRFKAGGCKTLTESIQVQIVDARPPRRHSGLQKTGPSDTGLRLPSLSPRGLRQVNVIYEQLGLPYVLLGTARNGLKPSSVETRSIWVKQHTEGREDPGPRLNQLIVRISARRIGDWRRLRLLYRLLQCRP